MKGLWNDNEVKSLFSKVEECKCKNKAIRNAFLQHGKEFNRQPNSVRNYYYHEIDNLIKDYNRCQRIGIDILKHKKTNIRYFSKDEENQLMKEIDDLVAKGYSVRKACLILSNNDIGQMLRYQNKYRNYLAKQGQEKGEVADNVITFRKNSRAITEAELQSLFMGLVRLVKKNAVVESQESFRDEINKSNSLLRKTMVKLHNSESQLDVLKEKISLLQKENNKLIERIVESNCQKAKNLTEKFKSKLPEKIKKELREEI